MGPNARSNRRCCHDSDKVTIHSQLAVGLPEGSVRHRVAPNTQEDDGTIAAVKVMIRPLEALQAVIPKTGEFLGNPGRENLFAGRWPE